MSQTAISVKKQDNNLVHNSWEDRMELVRRKFGKDLNQTEWELFLYVARLYDLNPLLREIWAIKFRGQPAQIFTGRDGLLKIAHQSGMCDGMKTVLLIEQNWQALESDIAPKVSEILGAKCYVWRKDMSHPVEVSVKFSEYDKGRSTWKDKPDTMLRKVSESHCLRRAFSINSLYLPEEFKQAQEDASEGVSKNREVLESNAGEPPDEPPEEQQSVDPVYSDLPEEVQRTIARNVDDVIDQLADLSDTDSKRVKSEILTEYGSGSIEELHYTELRNLYKDITSRVQNIQ